MNDTRSKEQRIYDEAVRTRAEVHRKDRAARGFEHDAVAHVRSCAPCRSDITEHAKTCDDGKLLVAQLGPAAQ